MAVAQTVYGNLAVNIGTDAEVYGKWLTDHGNMEAIISAYYNGSDVTLTYRLKG